MQSSEEVSQMDGGTGEEEDEEEEEEEDESLLVFDESSVGTSITISNNGTTAARDRESFCNGVVFSKVLIHSKLFSEQSKVKCFISGDALRIRLVFCLRLINWTTVKSDEIFIDPLS